MKTTGSIKVPNIDPIIFILLIIAMMIATSRCHGQTFVELRGGSITNVDGGGAIGAGFTQHIDKTTLSAMFQAYTLGYDSYDSYDIELGRLIGNGDVDIQPVLGFGYNNQRSYNCKDDDFSLSFGGNVLVNIQGHKLMALYRYRDNIHIASIGFKLRFKLSKNKKHRFF